MKNYLLLSPKPWHDELFNMLSGRIEENWKRIYNPEEFNQDLLFQFKPEKIFIPHWSWIIPREIFESYELVVFHMTDLPYGRGGSPLQNLIVRGHQDTKISAIRVGNGIDTGPVYLKDALSLSGTASEIFERSVPIIYKMIVKIIDEKIIPTEQEGTPVTFKRRKPEEGCMNKLADPIDFYNYIRMLDAPDYPSAFIDLDAVKMEFNHAEMINDNELIAHVRIIKK